MKQRKRRNKEILSGLDGGRGPTFKATKEAVAPSNKTKQVK
jgi:hypothetical protein